MNIVLTTDKPPMIKARSAAAAVMAVKIAPLCLKLLTRSLGFDALTSGNLAVDPVCDLSSSLMDVPDLA